MTKSLHEFECLCTEGWTGTYCETEIDSCKNVTCKNGGICRSLFRNFKCECLSTSYYGRYCEITDSTLQAKKVASQSFGYVAVIFIISVISLVILLDALKYIFRIDPLRHELQQLKPKKRPKKKADPVNVVPLRFVS